MRKPAGGTGNYSAPGAAMSCPTAVAYGARAACTKREVFEVRQQIKNARGALLIASELRAQACPAPFLARNREHGPIENRLHPMRDTVCDEDRCRAHIGHTPSTVRDSQIPGPAAGAFTVFPAP